MKRLSKFSTIAAVVILQASAQTAYKPPHGPDGHPNLNGIWQAMNTANWNLEDHVAQQSLVVALGAAGAEPGGLSVVEGGKIPYLPAAVAKRKENFANRLTSDPEIKCYLPGVPRATYMPYPFQILQSAKAIAITYEYDGAFRNIFLKDPGPAPVDSWMGQSAGRWEGDTLVVDVVSFNDKGWLTGTGTFHSDQLHVTERYTRVDKDQIKYDVTMEDPKVLTNPWTIHTSLMLREGTRVQEYVCAENNLDPERYEKLLKDGVKFTRQ